MLTQRLAQFVVDTRTQDIPAAVLAGSLGIGDGLLRVAVGLENVEDLKADLARGLAR